MLNTVIVLEIIHDPPTEGFFWFEPHPPGPREIPGFVHTLFKGFGSLC